ncbi:hypothetical protein BDV95DRAFT_604352 [Massariosphaeria phaeospora]|uniref:Zn(2)-C6 fungal-type domain-containing protein n=1 Tax=Massariosphaeria phaeospora TaxID=100035 RepID=A0A7C8ID75_9PLEO|nr:hypothetical protein BDV95DRAFT_604352 [Massariosphaeria phaeospora]
MFHQQLAQYWPTPSAPQNPIQSTPYYAPTLDPGYLQTQEFLASSDESPAMSTTNEPAVRNGSKKRRACNECKQQKLKCDLSALGDENQPFCSRCRRLGFKCRIDQGFKRERKRKRSDELAKEVDTLKMELSRRSSVGQPTTGRTSIDGGFNYSSDSASTGSMGDLLISEQWASSLPDLGSLEPTPWPSTPGTVITTPISDGSQGRAGFMRPLAQEPRSLASVYLSTHTVDELFHDFFTRYHPSLPVLDPTIGPDQYYETSPLLFWAIISVASGSYIQPAFSVELAQPVTELVLGTLQSMPFSIQVVQSLCLLCNWPFPATTLRPDVISLWARSMVRIAIHIGLHQAMDAQHYAASRHQLSNAALFERVRTWTACNIVAQSLSVDNNPKDMHAM